MLDGRTLDSGTVSVRELNGNELDLVAGGLTLVGGPGSVVDVATNGRAVVGILGGVGNLLGSVGSLANGLLGGVASTGGGLLGRL